MLRNGKMNLIGCMLTFESICTHVHAMNYGIDRQEQAGVT